MKKIITLISLITLIHSCKLNRSSQLKTNNGANACSAIPSEFEQTAILSYGNNKLVISKLPTADFKDASVFLQKADGSMSKKLNFTVSKTPTQYILTSNDLDLEITITAFKKSSKKVFGRNKEFILPLNKPTLSSLKYNGKALSPDAMKIFSDEWFDNGFDIESWVLKPRDENVEAACALPSKHVLQGLNAQWQQRTGTCHAVATATVGSIVLQNLGKVEKGLQVPPTYLALKSWQSSLGSTEQLFLSNKWTYILEQRSIYRGGNILSDDKLTKMIQRNVYNSQGGLTTTDIELLSSLESVPLKPSNLVTTEDFNEVTRLSKKLEAIQNELIRGNQPKTASFERLKSFYQDLDSSIGKFETTDNNLKSFKLSTVEKRFDPTSTASQKEFWEQLEKQPLVGSYNNHAISILGYNPQTDSLYVYNSGALLKNYAELPVGEVFAKLAKYWIISEP